MFLLAERLGKTVNEILCMPGSEFFGWLSFDAYREQEREWAEQQGNKDEWKRAY